MIRLGIIGTGRTVSIANNHYQAILSHGDRAKLTAVYNNNLTSAQDWTQQNAPEAVACATLEQFLDNVDGVIICTPNNSHVEYARAANERGKSVLVEKPLGISLTEIESLVKNWKGDFYGAVGYVYRFCDKIVRLKQLVNDYIGRIWAINAVMGGRRLSNPDVSYEWRMDSSIAGTGALCDFGSHLIDISQFISKQRFDSSFVSRETVIKQRKKDDCLYKTVQTDDTAVISARGDGMIGSFVVSRVGIGDMRYTVIGQGGTAEVSMAQDSDILFWEKNRDGGYVSDNPRRIASDKTEVFFNGWFDKQMEDFLNGIDGRKDEVVGATLVQALYVERILHEANKIH